MIENGGHINIARKDHLWYPWNWIFKTCFIAWILNVLYMGPIWLHPKTYYVLRWKVIVALEGGSMNCNVVFGGGFEDCNELQLGGRGGWKMSKSCNVLCTWPPTYNIMPGSFQLENLSAMSRIITKWWIYLFSVMAKKSNLYEIGNNAVTLIFSSQSHIKLSPRAKNCHFPWPAKFLTKNQKIWWYFFLVFIP